MEPLSASMLVWKSVFCRESVLIGQEGAAWDLGGAGIPRSTAAGPETGPLNLYVLQSP